MASPVVRYSSYIAAGVLAVVTLSTFYMLQDYGPASAIRRFHQGVAKEDLSVVQGAIIQPVESPSVGRVVERVQSLIQMESPRVAGTERDLSRRSGPPKVRVVLVYRDIDGSPFPIVWVVEKPSRVWKINVDKTETIINDYLDIYRFGR